MKIDILTLFPEIFTGMLNSSITKRAIEKNLLEINTINFREFAYSKHQQVDDTAFGGGCGMVLKIEPIYYALENIKLSSIGKTKPHIIMMCPTGTKFSQKKAVELSKKEHLVFLCGHYEGFDARIEENLVDEVLSIGDYVLTGGEIPAMVIIDSISRMIDGVLGNFESAATDSFYNGILTYPQYTKPRKFFNLSVPEVLTSGDHKKIDTWRKTEALKKTYLKRPDLLEGKIFSKEEEKILSSIKKSLSK